MKIAIFTPLNPVNSGISDYTEEMLFEMAKHMDFDLVIDPRYKPENKEVRDAFPIRPYNQESFDPSAYDGILYHMGNYYSGHRYINEALKQFPGIVVLHDYALHGFYAERYDETRNLEEYRKLVEKYYPQKGELLAAQMAENIPNPVWESEKAFEYPLNEEVVESAKALIVHSEFVKKKLQKLTGKPIVKINQHSHKVKPFETSQFRKDLGIDEGEILLISAGIVNKNKRYEVVIRALHELGDRRIKYAIAGNDKGHILRNILPERKENIVLIGHLSLVDLERLISSSDICINLRFPTMGESSGSLLRMMSYGKPVLVTNYGAYAEFPDYCVLKINPDIDEKELVKRYIHAFVEDADFRISVGKEAQNYAETECSIEKCTKEYANFIKAISRGEG